MLNVIKWFAFIVAAFGSLIGSCYSLTNSPDKSPAFAILLIGICTSLYAFLFIPYANKFYLYELLIIIFTWAAELTVIFNLTRMKPTQDWMIVTGIFIIAFTTLIMPFIVFAYIEKRRPKKERLMEKAAAAAGRPPLAWSSATCVFLMIVNLFFILLMLAVMAESALPGRIRFQTGAVLTLVFHGVFFIRNWRAFRRLSNATCNTQKTES